MKPSTLLSLVGILTSRAYAFIGFGIEMYNPSCAFSCRSAIASLPLSCTEEGSHSGHMGHGAGGTTPACRAGDTSFLTTLAYCINSTCAQYHVEAWRLEKYWMDKTTGQPGLVPKWTFADTLQEVHQAPTKEFIAKETLNFTALIPFESWNSEKKSMEAFEAQETLHSTYGLVLLLTGFGIPILFTALGHVPYVNVLLEKVNPYLVYPSFIGTYYVRPLPFLLGNAPNIGQSLYIAFFFSLNLILGAVGYQKTPGNTWFETSYQEIMAYVSCRTGVLAFALAPLVILFSGRNNILLWMTNWSHSTYMLLHRWVARIFAVQVIVHSIVELVLYKDMGTLGEEQKSPYWIWGIVATLATCIMLVASHLYVRRWSYEIFLITHIILAVFVLAGSWYHVELLFTRKWGYELWLYAACAIWFSDRLIRVMRVVKVGARRAKVTEIGSDIVRVDVDGIRWSSQPGFHAYAYFPTLGSRLKPWENHPFSIIPTALLRPQNQSAGQTDSSTRSTSSVEQDVEKNGGTSRVVEVSHISTTAGVSLYIKKAGGQTKHLKVEERLLTFLDGPYPSNPTDAVLKCDRLVLIGGGIGITGILPFVSCHTNVKLCWSVKQDAEGLVDDMSTALDSIVEKHVTVGRRLDVSELLAQEARGGWEKIGVVVCGPGGLCDDVRAAVVKEGKGGHSNFELEVDAFSW